MSDSRKIYIMMRGDIIVIEIDINKKFVIWVGKG